MEKRIITKVNTGVSSLKSKLLEKLKSNESRESIISALETHPTDMLSKSDFTKRKRVKTIIPIKDRCIAKSAKHQQCTRRRKPDQMCCGTHCNNAPHGFVTVDVVNPTHIEVRQQDIRGIIYYIDDAFHVYKVEDIMANVTNPTPIGTWSCEEDVYSMTLS
jgi:hypothetical protein